MPSRIQPGAAILTTLFLAVSVPAQDPLTQAKQLYDAAEYDKVLTLAASVDTFALSVPLREYRALSFLALGRTVEAEQEVGAIIDADPLYAPSPTAPPRWQRVVDQTRARVWPEIIRRRYASAKNRFDARDFTTAVPELEVLQALLSAARQRGLEGLDAFIALTDGFLELSRAALPPPARAAPVVEPAPEVTAAKPEPVVVKPPIALQRNFPAWDRPIGIPASQAFSGRIAVLVGTDGSVKAVRLLDSVHPGYDGALITAARKWRFTPATKNGEPVDYEVETTVTMSANSGQR